MILTIKINIKRKTKESGHDKYRTDHTKYDLRKQYETDHTVLFALILVLIIHFSGLIFNCAKKRVASACLSIAKGKI